jgi:hypothetical protein
MLHMLQWLYTYIASFCFICFIRRMFASVYLDVAYVLHICCNCFIWMLRMFYNGFQVFFFKCLICLQTYVASVAFGCLKIDRVLHLEVLKKIGCCIFHLAFYCLALVSPPRLLLPCFILRLRRGRDRGQWRGHAGGWRRGRERALSPSLTRAGIGFRWTPVGGHGYHFRCQPKPTYHGLLVEAVFGRAAGARCPDASRPLFITKLELELN